MTVSGVLGWLNISGLALAAEIPEEVYAGEEVRARLRLRNRKRYFPSFLLQVATGSDTPFLPQVPRGEEEPTAASFVFPARGLSPLPECRIVSPFPINFFVRSRTVSFDGSCLVFPKPLETESPAVSGASEKGGEARGGRGYEGDLEKISDYTGSEPRKMIHWRLSARHDRYKVKHLSAIGRRPVLLSPRELPGRDLEEKLSRCVYLVNRLMAEGIPVGLELPDRVLPAALGRGHRLRLLGELAGYDRP